MSERCHSQSHQLCASRREGSQRALHAANIFIETQVIYVCVCGGGAGGSGGGGGGGVKVSGTV